MKDTINDSIDHERELKFLLYTVALYVFTDYILIQVLTDRTNLSIGMVSSTVLSLGIAVVASVSLVYIFSK